MPVAVMDRSREEERGGNDQAVEVYVAEMALVDLECDGAGAMALGRRRIRLAGTSVIAAAVFEIPAFDTPFGIRLLNSAIAAHANP